MQRVLCLLYRRVFRMILDELGYCFCSLVDSTLEEYRVGTRGDVLQAFSDHRLSEHRGGGCTVTGNVVGLGSDFFDELGSQVLELVLKVYFLGDRDTIVRDGWRTPALLDDNVPTLWTKRDPDGIGNFVDSSSSALRASSLNFNSLGIVSPSSQFSIFAKMSLASMMM